MSHLICRFVFSFSLSLISLSVIANVQLGPRPYFLVNGMDEGELKAALSACAVDQPKTSRFSIGHRGAPLQFPEHTKESYEAAALMGAGIIECDVTFTKDRELVCRHSQCDLHTTTNILAIPELAAKCSQGFTPAKIDTVTGKFVTPAQAKCCTSDITLTEFLQLSGKMDAANRNAITVEEYMAGTTSFRTDLYSEQGTLMTHAQSIELFQSLNVQMIPELKSADVGMPYESEYSQHDYAQQMLDDYINSAVPAENLFMQSFNLNDVRYWIDNAPEYGKQAVFLDGRYSNKTFDPADESSWEPGMAELKSYGVNYIAPPMWVLLQQSEQGAIVPSLYAVKAKEAGLEIMTWTLERSGLLASGGGWYYQSTTDLINNDGDVYTTLDVLAKEVGVVGVFSDWPATVTHYANCMDM